MQAPARVGAKLLAVSLLAVIVASCRLVQAPAGGASAPTATPVPTSPTPSAPPSASPSVTPSPRPTDPNAPHVATGLAIVRLPYGDRPVSEIFVVERDGELRQVTGLSQGDSSGGAAPVWSSDGEQIAYGPSVLGSGAFPMVLLVNADGTGQRVIAKLDVEEFSMPAWSQDGATLLYGDATPPGDRRIWLADVATGQVQRIGTGSRPAWLADGERIAYVDGVPGRVEGDPAALTSVVYRMGLSDRIPDEFTEADAAIWSPDGSAVLIQEGSRLLLANGDGSSRRQVAQGGEPAWSPDGSRFVYQSGTDEQGRSLLTLVETDGRQLWSGVVGSRPSWSPDGSRLAVQVDYPEEVVKVLEAATGELMWQTEGTQPAWRP